MTGFSFRRAHWLQCRQMEWQRGGRHRGGEEAVGTVTRRARGDSCPDPLGGRGTERGGKIDGMATDSLAER